MNNNHQIETEVQMDNDHEINNESDMDNNPIINNDDTMNVNIDESKEMEKTCERQLWEKN